MANEKRERHRQARQERIEREREEADARRRRRIGIAVGSAVLVVLAIVLISVLAGDDDSSTEVATDGDSPATTAPPATEAPPGTEAPPATEAPSTTGAAPGTDAPPTTGAPPADDRFGTGECPPEGGVDEPVLSFDDAPQLCIDLETRYLATLDTSLGEIVIELDPALDPVSVNNMIVLARYGYYDGVTFHRVIEGFVIQAGDPVGDPPGTGGPGYEIPGGLPTEPYEIGDVAMANRGSDPSTNGSQFFVITGPSGAALPPSFSPLGAVVGGLDVAQEIQAVETTGPPSDQPLTDVVIETFTVEPVS